MNDRSNACFLMVLLFVIALTPRAYNIGGHSLNADELNWITRGTDFVDKIMILDFVGSTDNFERHPGILSASLIGFSIFLFEGMLDSVVAARLPIAFLGALSCVVLFLLAKVIWNIRVGFLAALFLALSPFHISLSRFAHIDSTLAFFVMGSLMSYYIGFSNNDRRWNIVSAVFFGLAFLTKISALLIPVILLIWRFVIWIKRRKGFPVGFRDLEWAIVGIIVFFISYPLMWTDPINSVIHHFEWNFELNEEGHINYFLGRVTTEPSKLFYLVTTPIRLTELLLVCFVVGFLLSVKRFFEGKFDDSFLLLFLWGLIFFAGMTWSAKMGDRYMLPVWPVLCVFGAFGLDWMVVFLGRKFRFVGDHVFTVSVCCVLVFLLPWVFLYSPNYYLYYNLFVGGPEGAKRYVLVGWGEGHKEAAEYIIQLSGNNKKISLMGYQSMFSYYYGQPEDYILDARNGNWMNANFLVINNNMIQRYPDKEAVEYTKTHTPLYTVVLNGVQMAWIYRLSESDFPIRMRSYSHSWSWIRHVSDFIRQFTDYHYSLFQQDTACITHKSVYLLRQDKWEIWDGTYIDFTPERDFTIHNITFDVMYFRGKSSGLNFDWYIGLDDGPFNIKNPVLVKNDYVPAWKKGVQTIVLDVPYSVKANTIYTLYINSTSNESTTENCLGIPSKITPGIISYGIRRFANPWSQKEMRTAELQFD